MRDTGGLQDGWDRFGTWTINSGPSNLSLSPSTGSSPAGTPRTLTTRYTDPNGATNITDARILISADGDGVSDLYARYDRVNNRLYLANNNLSGFSGGFAPGSANTINNSQGSLNCAATTVSQVGNVLTINWRFTPTAGFIGTKSIFLFVRDNSNLSDGWDLFGTWTITGSSSSFIASRATPGGDRLNGWLAAHLPPDLSEPQ